MNPEPMPTDGRGETPQAASRRLPPVVLALGGVSLLNDAASEMIYPLLPAFLAGTLGAGPAFLGLIEGLAEAVASVLKLASGWLSDRFQKRKAFLLGGYALANAARPLLGLATSPFHVLSVRVLDRVGKGVRSAPRDALLAEAVSPEQRGRAFGFHRSMDHAGALVGPLLASALLWLGADLRTVFLASVLPGIAAVAFAALAVKEGPVTPVAHDSNAAGPSAKLSAEPVSAELRRYLAVLAVFALGNSADAFLLLRAQQAGVEIAWLPLLWSFHHLVKSLASTWGGAVSDRLGRRFSILLGYLVYALSYAGFAFVSSAGMTFALFGLYGLYFALVEGAEKALVADLSPRNRGRAFGLFHMVTGLALLPASLLTGALWQWFGPVAALGFGAACAAVAATLMALFVPEPGVRALSPS